MFIVALFTVAKTWKLPKCPSRWMQKEDVVHSIQWNIIQSLSSFQFSHSVMSASLQPQGLQHARLPCPSPSPIVCSNSCPLSWWCLPTISSSVIPFSSCVQGLFQWVGSLHHVAKVLDFPASASVLPINIQGWFPSGLTGLISLLSKRLSRVFSSTTVQRHQFFRTKPFLLSNSHICTWLLERP